MERNTNIDITYGGQLATIKMKSKNPWQKDHNIFWSKITHILWVIKFPNDLEPIPSYAYVLPIGETHQIYVPIIVDKVEIYQIPLVSEDLAETLNTNDDGILKDQTDFSGTKWICSINTTMDSIMGIFTDFIVRKFSLNKNIEIEPYNTPSQLLNAIERSDSDLDEWVLDLYEDVINIEQPELSVTTSINYIGETALINCVPKYNGKAKYLAYFLNNKLMHTAPASKGITMIGTTNQESILKVIPLEQSVSPYILDDGQTGEDLPEELTCPLLPFKNFKSILFATSQNTCEEEAETRLCDIINHRLVANVIVDRGDEVLLKDSGVETQLTLKLIQKKETEPLYTFNESCVSITPPDLNINYLISVFQLLNDGSYKTIFVYQTSTTVDVVLPTTGIFTFLVTELPIDLNLTWLEQTKLGTGQFVWTQTNGPIKITSEFGPGEYCCKLISNPLSDFTKLLGGISNKSWRKTYLYKNSNKITELWNCYYQICEKLLCSSCNSCQSDPVLKDLEKRRDWLWMYLNVITYAQTTKQYWKIQKYIEKLESCDVLCADLNKTNSCGCNK